MKSARHILSLLVLTALAAALSACQSRTFADEYSAWNIFSAASIDIPESEGQIVVDGSAVLEIIRDGVSANRNFTPTTLVSFFDESGASYLLLFSADRRYFQLDDKVWRRSRQQTHLISSAGVSAAGSSGQITASTWAAMASIPAMVG